MSLPKLLATRSRRRQFAGLLGLGLVQAACVLGGASVLGMMVRGAGQGGFAPWHPVAVLGLAVLALVLSAVARARAERFGQGYVAVCRVRLLKAMVRSPAGAGPHGLAMTRMITDLSSIKTWVAQGIASGATSVTFLVGLTLGASVLAPAAVLPLALVLGLVGLGVALGLRPLSRAIRAARSARGRLSIRVGDALLALPVLRVFGRLNAEKSMVYDLSRDLSQRLEVRMFRATLLRNLPETAGLIGAAVLLFQSGPGAAGTVGPALWILLQSVGPLRALARAADHWANYREGRARLSEALARGGKAATAWDGAGPAGLDLRRLVAVPGAAPLRRDLPAGSRVALPADAAHRAMLRVVAGLTEPHAGRASLVRSDGSRQPCARTTGGAVLVAPEVPLRRGSLAAALRDGRPGASRRHLRAALIRYGVAQDDAAAKSLLTQRVGPDMRPLSEDMMAALRLIRAALARPGIILIDEPALALSEQAREVLGRLQTDSPASLLVIWHEAEPPAGFQSWAPATRPPRPKLVEVPAHGS